MNSIREEAAAFDTNVCVFAVRRDPDHPACETLLFDRLNELSIYLPLHILVELQRNLSVEEMRGLLLALSRAQAIAWDYSPASSELVSQWERLGAKKGDAVIAAHLEASGIRYLVSENRHFLAELSGLPFTVLTSEEALRLLDKPQ
jgi:predicted nucleic acid-binding protein